jgi:hypothetical protein
MDHTILNAHSILPLVAAVFLIAAASRFLRDGRRFGPAVRTRLLVALIFAAVSAFLWVAVPR